jgi:TetR/AcrR family transcriptional regulator, regulator of cefoperazone and chloramphenicol sensitivity
VTRTPLTIDAASSNAATRDRLLEAAAQEFAEHGFKCATVRNICQRAGANVAAVNYHFGDKEQLYAATLQHWLALAIEKYPPDMGVRPDAPPEERLLGFVRGFLFRMLGKGAPAWHGQLMAREMVEPTAAVETVASNIVRPLSLKLELILRDLLGTTATEEVLRQCTASVVGQCCFYRHCAPLLAKLYPQQCYGEADLEQLARHITQFSLEGLRAYRQGGGPG